MNDFKIGDRVIAHGKKGFVRNKGDLLDITLDDNGSVNSCSAKPDPEFKGFHVGDRVNILNEYGTYTISEIKYIGSVSVAIFRNIAGDKNDLTIPISSLHLVESGEKKMEQENKKPVTNENKWRPIAEWEIDTDNTLYANKKNWFLHKNEDTTHFLVLPKLPKLIDLNELSQEKRDAIRKIMES